MGSGIARKTTPRKMSAKREAELKARGVKPFSTILGERKPVRKSNPERKARKTQQYRKGLAAYRKSETYKAVEKRSGGQCERQTLVPRGALGDVVLRCPNQRGDGFRMTHNHKTYARFGGHELPSDIELLCPSCNALYESQKRGTRRFAGAREGGV